MIGIYAKLLMAAIFLAEWLAAYMESEGPSSRKTRAAHGNVAITLNKVTEFGVLEPGNDNPGRNNEDIFERPEEVDTFQDSSNQQLYPGMTHLRRSTE